jgi:phenylpropionate dioxygenase-like ring-hydroxylating dioxygenase large terminal subunit
MLRNAWYVAAWANEIRTEPLARTLLGRRVMLLRTGSGRVTALGAQCPHRHGDLSRGELRGDRIRCPYHGWSFDMSGRCVEIPGTSRIPEGACVPNYPVVEQQGMVWIWLGDPSQQLESPPRFDFSPSPIMRRQRTPARLWDAAYVDLVENTLDPTHITATHARTLGSRWAEHVGVMSNVEMLPDELGFIGRAGQTAEATGFASRRQLGLSRILTPPIPQNAVYRFEFGGAVHAIYGYGEGNYDYAFAAITPCDEQRSWFFAEVGRWHRLSLIGDIMQFAAMRVLQREDYGVVRGLIHDDVRPPGSYVGIPNDRMMNTFRSLYHRKLRAESRAEMRTNDG